jgi:hypothetical protein
MAKGISQLPDDSTSFLDIHNSIRGNVIQNLAVAARPNDLNHVGLLILAQSKMQAVIVM